jgi:hypothetical protein
MAFSVVGRHSGYGSFPNKCESYWADYFADILLKQLGYSLFFSQKILSWNFGDYAASSLEV